MLPHPSKGDTEGTLGGRNPTLEGKMACMSVAGYAACAKSNVALDAVLDEIKVIVPASSAQRQPALYVPAPAWSTLWAVSAVLPAFYLPMASAAGVASDVKVNARLTVAQGLQVRL